MINYNRQRIEYGSAYWGRPLFVFSQEHQVVGHHVAHVQIYDPVHQVEANEADREHDARVLVDVRRSDTEQLVDVLQNKFS